MNGQRINRTDRQTFSDYVGSFLGTPWKKCGNGSDGYDCYGFVRAFYAGLGARLPDCFASMADYMASGEILPVTLSTYHDYYTTDRDAADTLLLELAETLGTPVAPKEAVAGDFLVVRHSGTGHLFPAVYTGNGHCAASFLHDGVRIVPMTRGVYAVAARRLL